MDTIKLISEAVEEVEYITEAKEGGGKNYKIKGIFLQADIKNRNGRVYPMEVLQKEVEVRGKAQDMDGSYLKPCARSHPSGDHEAYPLHRQKRQRPEVRHHQLLLPFRMQM